MNRQYGHGRTSSETQTNRLPGFNHFLKEAGQSGLTGGATEDAGRSVCNTSHAPHTLFTPLTTNGHVIPEEHRQRLRYQQPTLIFDHNAPSNDLCMLERGREDRHFSAGQFHGSWKSGRSYSYSGYPGSTGPVPDWHDSSYIHNSVLADHCGPVVPNGLSSELTNASWGITKAGKPRKRLGQACNQCRDKKIKCDGRQTPKCSQCDKFDRDCVFEVISRQTHKRPKSRTSNTRSPRPSTAQSTQAPSPTQHFPDSPTGMTDTTELFRQSFAKSSPSAEDTLSPVRRAPLPSRLTIAAPVKRQRLDGDDDNEDGDRSGGRRQSRDTKSKSKTDCLGFDIDVDPYVSNERITSHYLAAYMDYINTTVCDIFPRNQFMDWAQNASSKSRLDKMVLFAMLALGTTHSTQGDRLSHRRIFESIAYQELESAPTMGTLQAVHTALLLINVAFAELDHERCSRIFEKAVTGIRSLRLNFERSGTPEVREDVPPYGMAEDVYLECRRRTFWAAYVSDSFVAFAKHSSRHLHNDDIFLRLPCARDAYEKGDVPCTAFFDSKLVALDSNEHRKLEGFAYVVQLACLMGEVSQFVVRCQQYALHKVSFPDASLRASIADRLRAWMDQYRFGNAARRGKANDKEPAPSVSGQLRFTSQPGLYAGHEIMYHLVHMELNRHIYHPKLSDRALSQHAQKARAHAEHILTTAKQIVQTHDEEEEEFQKVPCGPVAGFAIFTAIEIITAAGRLSDILENESRLMNIMYSGLTVLDQLAPCWEGARKQHELAEKRVRLIFSSANQAMMQRKVLFFTTSSEGINMGESFDLVYGTDRLRYLRSLYPDLFHATEPTQILEIEAETEFSAKTSPSAQEV